MRPPAPLQHATELSAVRDRVGAAAYTRALEYAHHGRVLQVLWDADSGALLGSVGGSGGSRYTTTARLAPDARGLWMFERGDCSCPIGRDCKHVAALVIVAAGIPEPEPAADLDSWEQSLSLLLTERPAGERSDLALELSLRSAPVRPPGLMARPVRPGKRGGWVAGNLSWSGLDSVARLAYDDAQVQALRELYALYVASADTAYATYYSYRFGFGADKSIELSAIESAQLWPLLDQARRAGLRLVHATALFGELAPIGSARVCLDVTGSPSLTVDPVLQVTDRPSATAVRFIGSRGHGVVFTEEPGEPESTRFDLATVEGGVPRPLQELMLSGRPLRIPAAEAGRFRDEYYPRLRRTAAVISSDASFTPPAITGPELVLTADHGGEHDLWLSWEWAYRIGDTRRRIDPDDLEGADGYRDLDSESALIAGLPAAVEEFGLRRGDALVSPARLHGIDTMRCCTELLPLLQDHSGVRVQITGAPVDYREVGDSVVIGVSTFDITGETDWFDLGVSVTAEGRTVPFVQVFGALAAGESCLLLPDGAYFSLEKPELVRLRTLIEEARALNDGPEDRITI
ncbi:MAG TPA: helicase, partial [Mycobacteriales bacterium]|nr:helicase [Mycobacteriales bacterium]